MLILLLLKMRTLCVILLMGILAYVQADDKECYPFATGVEETKAGPYIGSHVNNRTLKLTDFLNRKKTIFYTWWATPSMMPEANTFCTAATYGSICGGIQYFMKFKDGYDVITDNFLQDIQFDMTSISYNAGTYGSIVYKMTIGGISKDKYIFQWVEDTPITAELIAGTGRQEDGPIDIPLEVQNALKSKFALFSHMPGRYSLYVTCDGETAWATYDRRNPISIDGDEDLYIEIEKLKSVVYGAKGTYPQIKTVNPLFPENLVRRLKKELSPKDLIENRQELIENQKQLLMIQQQLVENQQDLIENDRELIHNDREFILNEAGSLSIELVPESPRIHYK